MPVRNPTLQHPFPNYCQSVFIDLELWFGHTRELRRVSLLRQAQQTTLFLQDDKYFWEYQQADFDYSLVILLLLLVLWLLQHLRKLHSSLLRFHCRQQHRLKTCYNRRYSIAASMRNSHAGIFYDWFDDLLTRMPFIMRWWLLVVLREIFVSVQSIESINHFVNSQTELYWFEFPCAVTSK